MVYLSQDGATALKHYKYSGADLSYIYRYVLTPMNIFLIQYFPTWMAPNVITLLGLVCSLTAHLVCLYFSPGMDQPMPSWVYVLVSVCLFAYQTLDNLDGRQARRTNSSSPLGLLFDHGVDALNVTLSTLTVATCVCAGSTFYAFTLWSWTYIPFVFATWEEYYVGALTLGVINGPTDGIVLCIVCVMMNVYKPGFWCGTLFDVLPTLVSDQLPAWMLAMRGASFLGFLGIFAVGFTVVSNLYFVFSHLIHARRVHSEAGGKASVDEKATPTAASAFIPLHDRAHEVKFYQPFILLLPFAAVWLNAYFWASTSPSSVFERHPRMFLFAHGFLFCNMVCKLMLAHLTVEHFNPVRFVIVPILVSGANSIFYQGQLFDETYSLYVCLAWAFGAWLHFVINIILEVSTALNIRVFKINPVAEKRQ